MMRAAARTACWRSLLASSRAVGSRAAAATGTAAGATSVAPRHWGLLLASSFGLSAAALQLASSAGPEAECKAAADPPVGAADGTPVAAAAEAPPARKKTRVVVLGTGWGAISFLKNLDSKAFSADGPYELVLVSPRSYFL